MISYLCKRCFRSNSEYTQPPEENKNPVLNCQEQTLTEKAHELYSLIQTSPNTSETEINGLLIQINSKWSENFDDRDKGLKELLKILEKSHTSKLVQPNAVGKHDEMTSQVGRILLVAYQKGLITTENNQNVITLVNSTSECSSPSTFIASPPRLRRSNQGRSSNSN